MTGNKCYIARDGTIFYNQDDCIEYNYYICNLPSCLHFYDKNFDELIPYKYNDPDDAYAEITDIYSKAEYMVILPTSNMRERINFTKEYFGFPGIKIKRAGMWKYDYRRSRWRRLKLIETFGINDKESERDDDYDY